MVPVGAAGTGLVVAWGGGHGAWGAWGMGLGNWYDLS